MSRTTSKVILFAWSCACHPLASISLPTGVLPTLAGPTSAAITRKLSTRKLVLRPVRKLLSHAVAIGTLELRLVGLLSL